MNRREGPSLRSGRCKVALALLLSLCSACDFYYYRVPSPDELWHIIPWFDHMIHARYIRPYETQQVPRYSPEGSVPVSGSEPDWSGRMDYRQDDHSERPEESTEHAPRARPLRSGDPEKYRGGGRYSVSELLFRLPWTDR